MGVEVEWKGERGDDPEVVIAGAQISDPERMRFDRFDRMEPGFDDAQKFGPTVTGCCSGVRFTI